MNIIQKKELLILKEIIKVIEGNGLRYFAIGGTCIGAVRHYGFIPWDDDIDIAMPRKDYELFRTKLYKELPHHLKKLDCDNSQRNLVLFTKIYDANTTYVEECIKDSPDRYTGVFVDVMPIDGLPSGRIKRIIINKYSWLMTLNGLIRPVPYGFEKKYGVVKKNIKDILHYLFRYNLFSDILLKKVLRYDFDEAKYVYFTWRSPKECNITNREFPQEYFNDYTYMTFEDTEIRVPVKYSEYLKQDFGDYMQLPPKEEQKSNHDIYICDLEKPCEYYAVRREEEEIWR